MSLNSVSLIGNLVADPEVRFINDDVAVCNFRIACNERYKDRDGELVEKPMFIECNAWNRQGEIIGEHFVKGQQIGLTGSLQLDQWESDEGEKRSKHKIRVHSFTFTGTKADNEKLRENRNGNGNGDDYDDEEDVPF